MFSAAESCRLYAPRETRRLRLSVHRPTTRSSIVRLRQQDPQRHEGPGGEVYFSATSQNGIVVTARRLGRTTVRVRLGPSASDTMPSSRPLARALGREVNVTLPIARLELMARRTR